MVVDSVEKVAVNCDTGRGDDKVIGVLGCDVWDSNGNREPVYSILTA